MSSVNETSVLNFYIEQIHQDTIFFLKGRDEFKQKIEQQIILLRDEENMHVKINHAKVLWKLLFEVSMSFIDPDKSGYDRLFKYFDQFVDFEELIFASDSFYRDHTLHCLWVYFLGEYIVRNEKFYSIVGDEKAITEDYNRKLDDIRRLNNDYFKGSIEEFVKSSEDSFKYFTMRDSIRCISALTHDLGYPLKKINRINKCIKDVLPFYDIENYDEFNFHYSGVQQSFINNFIEMMSWEFTLSTSKEYEDEEIEDKFAYMSRGREIGNFNWEALDKATPEELARYKKTFIMEPRIWYSTSLRYRYANDFEKYQHGIMSAFLLVKNVNAFLKMNIVYHDSMNVPNSSNNVRDIRTKMSILNAITNHTSEGYQITEVISPHGFLTFIDELEEFSRLSRANQNRKYVNEFCKTDIYMEKDWFAIDFIFNNTEIDNLDPEMAFKGRCKKFLTLFNIQNLRPSLKIRLRCIGELSYDNNTYTLEIANKYANIKINDVEQNIPKYLKSTQFYTKEEYMSM